MNNTIYGIIDSTGGHIDIGLSLKGAKRYATLRGYREVSARYDCGYHVEVLYSKERGKWIKQEDIK